MKVSILIPMVDGPATALFLGRLFMSISIQTFTDYEIVVVKEGRVAHNLNEGIKKCKGELIKIMCIDDWFSHPNALKDMVDNFEGHWLITGCHNNPHPTWNDRIIEGYNTLGGLSVILFKNEDVLYFDEEMDWFLDLDWYHRMKEKFGLPKILDLVNINIGTSEHQLTNKLTDEDKIREQILTKQKYGN